MRVHGARPPMIRCTSDLEYPGRGRTRHAGGIAVRGASREAFVTGRTWLRRTAARRGRFAARRVVRPRGAPRRARAGFSRRRAPRATRRGSARGRRRPRACRSRRSRRWRTSDEQLGSATCEPESWLPPSARRRGCAIAPPSLRAIPTKTRKISLGHHHRPSVGPRRALATSCSSLRPKPDRAGPPLVAVVFPHGFAITLTPAPAFSPFQRPPKNASRTGHFLSAIGLSISIRPETVHVYAPLKEHTGAA